MQIFLNAGEQAARCAPGISPGQLGAPALPLPVSALVAAAPAQATHRPRPQDVSRVHQAIAAACGCRRHPWHPLRVMAPAAAAAAAGRVVCLRRLLWLLVCRPLLRPQEHHCPALPVPVQSMHCSARQRGRSGAPAVLAEARGSRLHQRGLVVSRQSPPTRACARVCMQERLHIASSSAGRRERMRQRMCHNTTMACHNNDGVAGVGAIRWHTAGAARREGGMMYAHNPYIKETAATKRATHRLSNRPPSNRV